MPEPIEWLTNNGNCDTARNIRAFARGIWLVSRSTPVSSPQSNDMTEAFVSTLERDYVRVNPTPNAQSILTNCLADSPIIHLPQFLLVVSVHKTVEYPPLNHRRQLNAVNLSRITCDAIRSPSDKS